MNYDVDNHDKNSSSKPHELSENNNNNTGQDIDLFEGVPKNDSTTSSKPAGIQNKENRVIEKRYIGVQKEGRNMVSVAKNERKLKPV